MKILRYIFLIQLAFASHEEQPAENVDSEPAKTVEELLETSKTFLNRELRDELEEASVSFVRL